MSHDKKPGATGDEQRQSLLKAIVEAYKQLAADPDALAELRAERHAWDATLTDGLPSQP